MVSFRTCQKGTQQLYFIKPRRIKTFGSAKNKAVLMKFFRFLT